MNKRNFPSKIEIILAMLSFIFPVFLFYLEPNWGIFSLPPLFLLMYYIYYLKKKNQELENAIKKYEDPDETKNKIAFIGKMSLTVVHDLKNPMSTIQTLVEMANTEEIGREERIQNLNLIHREIRRLSDMAYEILDFVKGKLVLNIESVNLEEFMEEVSSFLKIDFEYAEVALILKLEYRDGVKFDPEKVRRVIVNLARNALEAMYDRKKKYSFTISSKKQNGNLVLSFSDNGPGLPESIQQRIFQTFATEGKANGTGIGLYMAKWTMDSHKGEIHYETESGKGTTFTLLFPLGEEP